jgi:hypothetical protein
MSRCGCPEEDVKQSGHSPAIVVNEEPIVFALVLEADAWPDSIESFKNSKLKERLQSFCRSAHCCFNDMYDFVVKPQLGGSPERQFKGYLWALTEEVRSIPAKRNNMRDKTPSKTPANVGAFCVIDDGEPGYEAHARVG